MHENQNETSINIFKSTDYSLDNTKNNKSYDKFLPIKKSRMLASLTLVLSVAAIQNYDEYDKWNAYGNNNYYLSVTDGCEEYVDMDRDLSIEIPSSEKSIKDVKDVIRLMDAEVSISDINFAPQVSGTRSSAEKLERNQIEISETFRQIRDFFDHNIESFTLPTSGLEINIYSSVQDPNFEINHDRFDELFHSSLDPKLKLEDPHYNETITCTREAFDFPESVNGQHLDLFILPDTGYCFMNLQYASIDELPNKEEDCGSNGFTPPNLKLEFLLWDLVNEDIMMLSYKENSSVNSINKLFVHESAHYWLNKTGRNFEMNPEERFIKALTLTIEAFDIANLRSSDIPVINYGS